MDILRFSLFVNSNQIGLDLNPKFCIFKLFLHHFLLGEKKEIFTWSSSFYINKKNTLNISNTTCLFFSKKKVYPRIVGLGRNSEEFYSCKQNSK